MLIPWKSDSTHLNFAVFIGCFLVHKAASMDSGGVSFHQTNSAVFSTAPLPASCTIRIGLDWVVWGASLNGGSWYSPQSIHFKNEVFVSIINNHPFWGKTYHFRKPSHLEVWSVKFFSMNIFCWLRDHGWIHWMIHTMFRAQHMCSKHSVTLQFQWCWEALELYFLVLESDLSDRPLLRLRGNLNWMAEAMSHKIWDAYQNPNEPDVIL